MRTQRPRLISALCAALLVILVLAVPASGQLSPHMMDMLRRVNTTREFGRGGRGGDDTVHLQGTQRLINRLIDLNKQFSFFEYPNRRHGISGLHIDTMRSGFFAEHLPAGGR